eukprot:CAMPEP_0167830726 /NCGR_PEP_ID=MMETSP0112_2-20121227/13135_1 /TAXON_ID=91324 /ORGANISM="Lotharella globosa, Strain CCCM811" /LENGTH=58 /DNA_ID=CAMNT_0007735083 /DNA_START=266 /DNA_END=439 /DNA_ORIENTATION=+
MADDDIDVDIKGDDDDRDDDDDDAAAAAAAMLTSSLSKVKSTCAAGSAWNRAYRTRLL